MIKWCNCNSAKIHYPTPEEYHQASKDFNNMLGGYKIAILNHVRGKEMKYNVVRTDGRVFCTNNKVEFLSFLEKRI